jgi:hypothetical protein
MFRQLAESLGRIPQQVQVATTYSGLILHALIIGLRFTNKTDTYDARDFELKELHNNIDGLRGVFIDKVDGRHYTVEIRPVK